MSKFHLFIIYANMDPGGGMDDYAHSFDTLEDAIEATKDIITNETDTEGMVSAHLAIVNDRGMLQRTHEREGKGEWSPV